MNSLSGHIHCTSFQQRPFTHHGAAKQTVGRIQRSERNLNRQITCSGRQLGSEGELVCQLLLQDSPHRCSFHLLQGPPLVDTGSLMNTFEVLSGMLQAGGMLMAGAPSKETPG